ncbi:hypothetical protein MKX01_030627 [Papaver californicum]|nr:hypothetical protein MKX01_030627 [Papaver californicum]
MDTEFPGVIFKSNMETLDYNHQKQQTPFDYYEIMKKNVDALKLIQVGLTLSDSQGNLPDFGTHTCIWQFNLSDFDIAKDLYADVSIELLKEQGINFEKNRRDGYDFGYLIKLPIYPNLLPTSLEYFMGFFNHFFGTMVYDIKHMMKFCKGL